MSNHITSGPEFLYEDEGFRICQYGIRHKKTYTFIEHKCMKEDRDGSGAFQNWRWHVSDPEVSGIECRMCDTRPPEGLQAVFWFVSGPFP